MIALNQPLGPAHTPLESTEAEPLPPETDPFLILSSSMGTYCRRWMLALAPVPLSLPRFRASDAGA